MEYVKPPEPLGLATNGGRTWKLFRQKFDFFLAATECSEKPRSEAAKTALFFSVAGEEALEVYNNFTFSEGEDKQDYATVIAKLEEYYVEQQNTIHERYVFRSRLQNEAEPFEQFLRALNRQAQFCNFGTMMDEMVRDQIVFGTNSQKLREKMLMDKLLTLDKAVALCKAAETSARENVLWKKTDGELHALAASSSRSGAQGPRQVFKCFRCSRTHAARRCPAYGKTCYLCKGRNHFASCCETRDTVREVQHDFKTLDQNDDFNVLDVAIGNIISDRDWIMTANVEGKDINFKIDTWSQANLIPLSLFRKSKAGSLKTSHAVLRSYSGSVIIQLGKFSTHVTIGDRKIYTDFFVVKKDHSALLGLKASEDLGLIKRNVDAVTSSSSSAVVEGFPQLFKGTGRVQREYRITLREDAVPVIQPARRVPLALREPFRAELQRMEAEGIIEKVSSPTDWVTQCVNKFRGHLNEHL
ncbi:uncharacterized protein [Dermacentor andersoni]|uniref:uncharacterized protein n=1 Tax=Dermacentor andersoni TaxID=34620 RepID=UPI003B3B9208